MNILEVEDLHYSYLDNQEVLSGVTLSIAKNERVGLIGPNGAGKSTLIQHLNGIITNDSVRVFGKSVKSDVRQVRNQVGLVFQDCDDQLFMATIGEDIAFGPYNQGLRGKELQERVKWALDSVGLPNFEERNPHTLSGGEKRRIAIATVLAMKPSLLILDEPTANMDASGKWQLIKVLEKVDSAILFASHDLEMVKRICEKVLVIVGGKIVASGTTEDILKQHDSLINWGLELPT